MSTNYLTEPLKVGAFVKIRGTNFGQARISEFRGPLGPDGARVYGLYVGKKPSMYIEVLEEQLEVLPPPGG